MTVNVQPKWPIFPVTQFIVYYYTNDGQNATPVITNNILETYEAALEVAQTYITNNGNVGVCVISQMAGTIVYPATYFTE